MASINGVHWWHPLMTALMVSINGVSINGCHLWLINMPATQTITTHVVTGWVASMFSKSNIVRTPALRLMLLPRSPCLLWLSGASNMLSSIDLVFSVDAGQCWDLNPCAYLFCPTCHSKSNILWTPVLRLMLLPHSPCLLWWSGAINMLSSIDLAFSVDAGQCWDLNPCPYYFA